jgi:chromosome segregation protein
VSIAGQAQVTEERLKAIEKDRTRLDEEIRALEERTTERSAGLEEFEKQHAAYVQTLESFAPELAELLADAAAKEAEYSEKTLRADELKAEFFELSNERSAKEAELASGEGLFSNFDEAETSIKSELSGSETERIKIAERVEALKRAVAEKSEEVSSLETREEALRKKYSDNELTLADNRLEAETLKIEAEKKSARQKTIEEMESNYEGYAQGVRSLMQTNLTGVIGVVTELIKTDPGFETAIETALGSGAQNIVTEDDAAAKRAIDYLKENKAGRLTFLPIKTLRSNAYDSEAGLESMKGFAGYAKDRITHDGKYNEVFSYLLGRTVIAETLDDAISMSANSRAASMARPCAATRLRMAFSRSSK